MATIAAPGDIRDRRWPDAEVLFDDDFSAGYEGWRQHQSGPGTQDLELYGPLSRTRLRDYDGGGWGLLLGLSDRPASPTTWIPDANCSTYKNLGRDVDSGKVTFQVWLTLFAQDPTVNPQQFAIGIDTQAWDDTHRGFYKLTCQRFTGPDETAARTNAWSVTKDMSGRVYINADGTGSDTVPATSLPYIGDNENKLNRFYVSITADLDAIVSDDGKPGSYHAAEVGPTAVDLRSLGAGRGKQNPQTASSFAGGLNFGVMVNNRTTTHTPNGGVSGLIVTRARAFWTPPGVPWVAANGTEI